MTQNLLVTTDNFHKLDHRADKALRLALQLEQRLACPPQEQLVLAPVSQPMVQAQLLKQLLLAAE